MIEKLERLKLPYEEWGWRGYPIVLSRAVHRRKHQPQTAASIWDRDWDVLLILDTCRVDWMGQVVNEYGFLEDVSHIWSVGGTSAEWIEKTFVDADMENLEETAYLTGNPYLEMVEESSLAHFDNANVYDTTKVETPCPQRTC